MTNPLARKLSSSFLFFLILFFISCGPNQEGNLNQPTQVKEEIPEIKKTAPCTDEEGNVYETIAIGSQIWMAENLKNTKIDCEKESPIQFTNGIERGPNVKFYDGTPRYAYYNNNSKLDFGVLYNFSAIQKCNLCPKGYRIPTKADWEELIDELGGMSVAGKKLIKGGISRFNAKMGGRIDDYGSVLSGSLGFWWSIDLSPSSIKKPEVYVFELTHQGIIRIKGQDIRVGNSIRCLKE